MNIKALNLRLLPSWLRSRKLNVMPIGLPDLTFSNRRNAEFAAKIDAKKLGLAFCGGLHREAEILCDIFETQGFEVFSVCCNAGGVPKEAIGIRENQKVHIGEYETMCNPLFQAEVLNQVGTDLNIVLGLCVGHDSLFFKKTTAMCTVLAVKDRVTGHNPLAALYTVHSYYQKLKS